MQTVRVNKNTFSSLLGKPISNHNDLELLTKEEVHKALNMSPNAVAHTVSLDGDSITVIVGYRGGKLIC